MTKDESVNITTDLAEAIDAAVAKAFANVASAASSSGTSTGNVQADAGIAGRYVATGFDHGADTGQSEAWTNLNLRRAENQEAFDQFIRLSLAQAGTNGQAIGNRQNNQGQADTEIVNGVKQHSLMLDNDWLFAYALDNPILRAKILAAAAEEKAK